ncbi:hypothetical protein [Streptomyces sp. NBC_01089]|uniref:hypothetical protein n=1 Tax=Streptomyces sp. NBC_01089 TaxID=2903747 RepID=UPI003868C6AD|nr:hypothetical protein OG510_27855 [Streptomyces sp. NBC_01089]
MATAQAWRRPELAGQPHLTKLNGELHDLRLDAGLPSARSIRDRVGKDAQGYWIVNHQAVLDAFQKPNLPTWGRLEVIVDVLAKLARRENTEREVNRFKYLWKRAFQETAAQASVEPPESESLCEGDRDNGPEVADRPEEAASQRRDEDARGPSTTDAETPADPDDFERRINYAEESLKGLIINASQALWNDKDALRVFLGIVRRSPGFVRLADASAENRPANATFYGVKSREFELEPSPAQLELVMLHNLLEKYRAKRKWSFTRLEEQTGVSSDAWIRWHTHRELPDLEALVAFSNVMGLDLEDHVLLLGLWERARNALDVTANYEALPDSISFDDAWEMRSPNASRMWALAGVGGSDLTAFGPDLASGTAPAFIVAGPPGSGRSTALTTIARSLLASKVQLVLAAPKPSPLRDITEHDGVMTCLDQGEFKNERLEGLISRASKESPIAFVIDDAEAVDNIDSRRVMLNLLQHGFDDGIAVVLGGHEGELGSTGYWLSEARKAHRGMLLAPREKYSGRLIGTKMADAMVGGDVIPGRGWLHLGDGKLIAVVVPTG